MSRLLALDEARRILLDGMGPLGTEKVNLAEALGRTAAEQLRAGHDQPPAPISAMDGYAVRAADAVPNAQLRLVGEAPAGEPYLGPIGPGECVKIATGGVVPESAGRVIMQENVTRDGAVVRIGDASGPSFIRPAGMDFAAGQVLLAPGDRLGAAEIGLLAAAGFGSVTVARRPRIAVLACGDELRDPGQKLEPGAIYNSAAFAVAALIDEWGGTAIRAPVLPDDIEVMVEAIRARADSVDLFVPLGGASVGERDLFRPAFELLGAQTLFWRINVMPGKPSWHARLPDGRAVLGLPGNPASAFVVAHLLLRPMVCALLGRDPGSAMSLSAATLATPAKENGSREAWLRATTTVDRSGSVVITADPRQDSGLQSPLVSANALLRRPPCAPAAPAGSPVEFLRMR